MSGINGREGECWGTETPVKKFSSGNLLLLQLGL